jgi:uncharacterized protein YozE (UPF0346 family)
MGYKIISSYLNSFYVDKGVQTDAWEDYSERPSQIASESVTSIDTVTPRISPIEHISQVQNISPEGTQNIIDNGTDVSTVTTILPIPPVDIPIVPNIELITKVDQGIQTVTNPMYGKDWNTIIDYINNKPSFFFDVPGCESWIIPDPAILNLISNSQFWS